MIQGTQNPVHLVLQYLFCWAFYWVRPPALPPLNL